MKKFFLATFLMAVLMLCRADFAEAYNYDCGAYPATGLHGYLMTETIVMHDFGFRCTIVCYPDGNPYYIKYNFWGDGFSNSDGYKSKLSWRTPVEQNAYDHVMSHYWRGNAG